MASVCSGPEKSGHGTPAAQMQGSALFSGAQLGQRIERLERAWACGYEEEIMTNSSGIIFVCVCACLSRGVGVGIIVCVNAWQDGEQCEQFKVDIIVKWLVRIIAMLQPPFDT